jgi:hypothetical protein
LLERSIFSTPSRLLSWTVERTKVLMKLVSERVRILSMVIM